MREHTNGLDTICIASDVFDQVGDFDEYLDWAIHSFTRRPLVKELLFTHSDITRKNGYLVVDAHGNGNPWHMKDGERKYYVQNWINQRDGTYSAIFFFTCNPEKCEIKSAQSIILHAHGDITYEELHRGADLRIYVPEQGYLDSCYKIKKAIKQLNQKKPTRATSRAI